MSSSAHLKYIAIGRTTDKVVIATHLYSQGESAAKYQNVAQKVLNSGKSAEHSRLTITHKELGTMHYDTDPATNCLYIVVTDQDYPQRTAFKFLNEVRASFTQTFGDSIARVGENGLSKTGRKLLGDACARYHDPGTVDKVTGVQQKVDATKDVMTDNLQQLLTNTENLEVVQDKAAGLRDGAHLFQHQAVDMKRFFWWRNMKMNLIIGLICVSILGYILIPVISSITEDAGERSSDSGSSGGNTGSDTADTGGDPQARLLSGIFRL